ncbi:helix-turn-helix domain-containing protein [Cecembia rubra]|uniref:Helix-turn-helix protein n=1 Tax=Cecembia rubra TaxID=1485585 RepID=A0A2P8EAR7_9BACT|nr:helix-turn-helix transcriptional regulator [Cecembia rubra]PSL06573.1 hypothetical protein CLV48_102390 [Cecembia rubra]
MSGQNKKVRYPQNKYLKVEVVKAERTIKDIAKEIGCSREVVSMIVNGHYKGDNIVPKIKEILKIK